MFIRALAFLWLVTQLGLGQQPTPIVPDPKLTPGDAFDVTAEDLCVPEQLVSSAVPSRTA